MHVVYKITGDGVLAFLGGSFALIAVWLSNRASMKNLERQLATEKQARQEEQMERKKALATALLYEVWDFYSYHVRPLLAKEKGSAAEHVKFFSRSFDVWKSNAGHTGQFDPKVVKELVHFHSVTSEYLVTLDSYRSLDGYDQQSTFFKNLVAPKLRRLEALAEKASLALCPDAGVDFQILKSELPASSAPEIEHP